MIGFGYASDRELLWRCVRELFAMLCEMLCISEKRAARRGVS